MVLKSSLKIVLFLSVLAWTAMIHAQDIYSIISNEMTLKSIPRKGADRQVLVVGLDGFTWSQIKPLISAGQMPNLAGLMKKGSILNLESTVFPSSAAAWPAITTGCTADQSGMYSFFSINPQTYSLVLNHSGRRKVKAIWEIVSQNGYRSFALNVPMSWPVDPINGVMIGGFLSDQNQVFTHPETLSEALRAANYSTGYRKFKPDVKIGEIAFQSVGQTTDLNDLMEISLSRYKIASHILIQCHWDFGIVVFTLPDRFQHNQNYLGDAMVHHAYRQMDVLLGGILRQLPEKSGLIVCSDHGFTKYSETFFLAEKLRRAGFIASDHQGRPDWSRSKLIPLDRVGTAGLFRWNISGREADGVLAESDVPQTLEILKDVLNRTVDSQGKSIDARITRVKPTPDGADFIITLRDKLYLSNDSPVDGPLHKHLSFPVFDHEREGFGVLYCKDVIQPGNEIDASVLDMTPTALYLMGLPVPQNMDGKVLTDVISPDWIKKHPPIRSGSSNRSAFNDVERSSDAAAMEQLKSLGYIN